MLAPASRELLLEMLVFDSSHSFSIDLTGLWCNNERSPVVLVLGVNVHHGAIVQRRTYQCQHTQSLPEPHVLYSTFSFMSQQN